MSVQSTVALKPNQTKLWQFKCQARTECVTQSSTPLQENYTWVIDGSGTSQIPCVLREQWIEKVIWKRIKGLSCHAARQPCLSCDVVTTIPVMALGSNQLTWEGIITYNHTTTPKSLSCWFTAHHIFNNHMGSCLKMPLGRTVVTGKKLLKLFPGPA